MHVVRHASWLKICVYRVMLMDELCRHTVAHHSALKGKGFLVHENITANETIQTQRANSI